MRYYFEDFVFDTARCELRRGGMVVAVVPQVFDLLACLIENRERVVSKDDLLATVWKGRIVSESTLSSAINAARMAVGDSGEEQRLIRTFQRKGFRFVASVRAEPPPPAAAGEMPVSTGQEQTHRSELSGAGPAPVARPIRLAPATLAMLVAGIGAAGLIGATLIHLLWPAANAPQTAGSGERFEASSVPLVDDETRRSLASYPDRPDAKALAITGPGMAVSDGQPNIEAAKQDALQRCFARTRRQCRLYAVGMEVVWSKEALPLAAREDLRFDALAIPLVPDDIPTLKRVRRDAIARVHMHAPNHRALALTAGGDWTISGKATRAEASRLAIERCGEFWQRPCLVLSVDGLLTIQIPKSREVSRIFLPSSEADIPAEDRARIAGIYRGPEWRAAARGKQGSWHAVAAAPSEAAAIEAALKSCSENDTGCQLYAIGNFRVTED